MSRDCGADVDVEGAEGSRAELSGYFTLYSPVSCLHSLAVWWGWKEVISASWQVTINQL